MPAQTFRAEDSKKSDPLVEAIRDILDGHAIAVVASAVDIVRDDVHKQLQFKSVEFQEPTV